MEAEQLLKLYDSTWFEHKIFIKQPSSSNSETNPDHQNQQKTSIKLQISIPTTTSLQTRSMSDQPCSKTSLFNSVSLSPPKLHTILSGKEVTAPKQEHTEVESNKKKVNTTFGRTKKGTSKSLPELEFEELKGFMDLGFVFSEEDSKESSLVSIIPGLQRLGKNHKDGDEERERVDKVEVSRPYLSEAWEVLDRRKKEKPLMINWRVPASLSNEIDVKDNLRCWAHSVASTVR